MKVMMRKWTVSRRLKLYVTVRVSLDDRSSLTLAVQTPEGIRYTSVNERARFSCVYMTSKLRVAVMRHTVTAGVWKWN